MGTRVRNDLACLLSSSPLATSLVSLATIYSPSCQVFNSSTCTHAHLHTHTLNHVHVRVVRVSVGGGGRPAQLCRLFPGCVVIVKEGDLGFPLKSHQAEHLFKKALGAGGEEWVK